MKKGVPVVTITCSRLKSPATNEGITAAAPACIKIFAVLHSENGLQVPKVHNGHAAKGGFMHGMCLHAACMGDTVCA